MYCIQQMVTTGQTSMNHIPLPPPREPVASEFYPHPYGGVARDIFVSREGFARFFEIDPNELDWVECNIKSFDVVGDTHEILGYKIQDSNGRFWDNDRLKWSWNPAAPITYKITFINRTHGALMDYAVRNTVPNPQN